MVIIFPSEHVDQFTIILPNDIFSIKYAGWFSWLLGVILVWTQYWHRVLPNRSITNWKAFGTASVQFLIINGISVLLYISVFYVHLNVLKKAGPHDSVMTSAFQASLEVRWKIFTSSWKFLYTWVFFQGGLASITKGQPLQVAHGSQITLRHTHGRTCWLHSHAHVYPLRYADKRGSSHQQQVTCYTFKVNKTSILVAIQFWDLTQMNFLGC